MNVEFLFVVIFAIGVGLVVLTAVGIAVSAAGGLCGYLVGRRVSAGSERPAAQSLFPVFGAILGFALTAAAFAAAAVAGVNFMIY